MESGEDLEALNREIAAQETKGDPESRAWFDALLTDGFAMRRAGGGLIDKATFLNEGGPSAERRIDIFGIEQAQLTAVASECEAISSPSSTCLVSNTQSSLRPC